MENTFPTFWGDLTWTIPKRLKGHRVHVVNITHPGPERSRHRHRPEKKSGRQQDIYRYIIEYLWYIYIYHILLIVYIKSNEQRNEQIKVPTLLVSITVLIIINDMISDFV